ncbi:MAG: DUF1801 domain-containing protein [Chitinophagales bacterium]|nr:DUF1801 domain-containing protein [Chitinophagales bacterium]
MTSNALTVEEYLESLPEDRRDALQQLRKVILKNIPEGFKEGMGYGMIGYVVPHTIYPSGYHCTPHLPLPFMNIASQKNFIAVYHMGIYADPQLLDWFVNAYKEQVNAKLDMGKSCIRFKNLSKIPYDLIGALAGKMTVNDWISLYEKNLSKK